MVAAGAATTGASARYSGQQASAQDVSYLQTSISGDRFEIELSYAIGIAKPLSISIGGPPTVTTPSASAERCSSRAAAC